LFDSIEFAGVLSPVGLHGGGELHVFPGFRVAGQNVRDPEGFRVLRRFLAEREASPGGIRPGIQVSQVHENPGTIMVNA
jgi:hypothetical protein